MKIDIKPIILTAQDYHDFTCFAENSSRLVGTKIAYREIGSQNKDYRAIFWPEGAEDELFEFIFTNQESWEALTSED